MECSTLSTLVFSKPPPFMLSIAKPSRRPFSIMGTLTHIPWVQPFLELIPVNKAMRKMQAMGQQYARERTMEGSKTKDLFYYLVRPAHPRRTYRL